ncbi:uncharacterized protein LOC114747632 [Neltuma alba]|uniref:uncharacterized protein LOC114747632 n=1 Tax=Neltuma alba TaxID=207710 RepID=UPI0010A3FB2B|nr:uncharacterized protein LOC114747632 [Prosopis alba]
MEQKREKDFGETMYHPLHRHPVRLKRHEGNTFKCTGCKELGLGPRYHCVKNCDDFVLHEACFKARPRDRSRIHPLMGNCRFQFLWEPPGGPNSRLCDACGKDVRGFLYHDKSKHKLDLHPCCMNLKSTMSDPYGRMTLILKDKMPSKCVKCERKDLKVQSKEPFGGWSYVSSCGKCCYHVYCVKKLILDNWKRGYFNNVASSSSSRGRTLSRDEIARPIRRCRSVRQSDRSSIPSLALARRASSRPPAARFSHGLIKLAKIGFSVITSVVFGNPAPLLISFRTYWIKRLDP